ncbi:hypothetical protein BdWA1_000942 [Babesia duncani]|uniref:Uncharacterized protein n=1 Tax=Babesia duncani TaxID=323732 RepID=A0AAD9PN36_9APIC|nr:hypothetical protein BdWA1_000942 [Babesia duncani]
MRAFTNVSSRIGCRYALPRRRFTTACIPTRHRESLGLSQEALHVENRPLETATRVIYAIYNHNTPDLCFIASKTPVAEDFCRLYFSCNNKRNHTLAKWLSRYVDALFTGNGV